MKTNYDKFKDITNAMLVMYTEKNEKYGNSWEGTLDEFGYLPYIIRMNEKLKRAKTIVTIGDEDETETLEDILIDVSIYSVMTLMHLKNEDKALFENELDLRYSISELIDLLSNIDLYIELEKDGE